MNFEFKNISQLPENKNVLSLKQDKKFFVKIWNDFNNIPPNSDSLGIYSHDFMKTVNVFGELKKLGLIKLSKEYLGKIYRETQNSQENGEAYEGLARILLKNFSDRFFSEEEKNRREMAKKLIELGNRTGNHLDFKNFGSKFELTSSHANSQAKEGLNGNEIFLLEERLRIINLYQTGPIFTDEFHENHGDPFVKEDRKTFSRRDWERKYIKPETIGLETFKYYNSNKLGSNKMRSIIGFFGEIKDEIIKNEELKEKLNLLEKEIPKELKEEKGNHLYDLLSDDEKLEIVDRFSKLMKKVLFLLEEPVVEKTE